MNKKEISKKNSINIISAVRSNYEDMIALVDENNKVYLGKKENYHLGKDKEKSIYDNQDNSICFISNNTIMFHFLMGGGWVLSQKDMLEHGFTLKDYKEYDKLKNGVLKQFKEVEEIKFKGKPFISPEEMLNENEEECL